VGNSSSGIREAGFLGRPAVNIGDRQRGRERTKNVLDVGYDREEIKSAIKKQLEIRAYDPDFTYGDGLAGARIAQILSKCDLSIKKSAIYS
jgi:UDP-N-acetylglucosamine 2-epimerase